MSKQSLKYFTIPDTGESFMEDPTGFILIFKVGLILHCNWNFWPQESQWRPPNSGCCPRALVQGCKNPRDQQSSPATPAKPFPLDFQVLYKTFIASKMRQCARNTHLSKIRWRKYLICFIPTVTEQDQQTPPVASQGHRL